MIVGAAEGDNSARPDGPSLPTLLQRAADLDDDRVFRLCDVIIAHLKRARTRRLLEETFSLASSTMRVPCLAIVTCAASASLPSFASTIPVRADQDVVSAQLVSSRTVRPTGKVVGQPIYVSALGGFVAHVVGLRPEKQVRRVTARWVVARVADFNAFRDRPVGDGPCDPVGTFNIVPAHAEGAVAKRIARGQPRPTGFGAATSINLFVESFPPGPTSGRPILPVVAFHKTHRLPFHLADTVSTTRRHGRLESASAPTHHPQKSIDTVGVAA
jgi:hypothetical protein